ncbi:MAG TPA: glycosyltransferase [Oligoflexia bacterium]|nr:glycosyltransferase [Oligoflexia bacterium]
MHDWLTGMRGGERCLQSFLKIYPEADIFTLVHIAGSTTPEIDARVKQVSFLGKIPGIAKWYKLFLPLFPLAIRGFNFKGYDLIISLSHAAAKNIHPPRGTLHICYCFTPIRYVWDQARQYLGLLFYLAYPLIIFLRWWDRRGAARVTHFVAISRFVAARIRLYYGRKAAVIRPAIADFWLDDLELSRDVSLDIPAGDFFLAAGALVAYKKFDLAIDAFLKSGKKLLIAGDGPEMSRLKKRASVGNNIYFLGRVNDSQLRFLYRSCVALIFPGVEDFGLIPIECLATGSPVVAYGRGGVAESLKLSGTPQEIYLSSKLRVLKLPVGMLFGGGDDMARVEALILTIDYMAANKESFSKIEAGNFARNFAEKRFFSEWQKFIGFYI